MPPPLPLLLTMLTMLLLNGAAAQSPKEPYDDSRRGGPIAPKPKYLVIAPHVIRPAQVVNVHVIIRDMDVPQLTVTASIRKDGHEYAALSDTMHGTANRLLQMQMPVSATAGNYTLLVQGSTGTNLAGDVFHNETRLEFRPKHVSVFIQPDRYVYNKRQWIHFRVIAVNPNLLPVESGSVTIRVRDPHGYTCRRWLTKQLFNGHCWDKFYPDFPVTFGSWTIEVNGFGYNYSTKVVVENWFPTRMDVDIRVPTYVLDNEYAIAGTVVANFTNTFPTRGDASVAVRLERQKKNKAETGKRRKKRFPDWVKVPGQNEYPYLIWNYTYVDGVFGFSVPLSWVRGLMGDDHMVGCTVTIYATVYDWHFGQNKTNHATVTVFSSRIKIEFLGGAVRAFKPYQKFHCYIAAKQMDGTPLASTSRQIKIQRIVRSLTGDKTTYDTSVLVGDDGIAKYSFMPGKDDQLISVRAQYAGQPHGGADDWLELRAYRHYTASGHYIAVSSSTEQARVDTYMVFTVTTTVAVPEIMYMVIAGGNIVTTGLLFMKSKQKTFSLAISRDMIPEAKMLVFCFLNKGELINDVLNFNVKGIRKDGVKVELNKGKDFSGNMMELRGEAEPGSYIVFSGADYDMVMRGASTFFTEYMVEEDLKDYGQHTNSSFTHTWYDMPMAMRRHNVHFSSNTFAVDSNTTFAFAGMDIFTDAMVARVPGAMSCNVSQGFLPCHDGTCYPVEAQCDSYWNCEDGADEMGCTKGGTLPMSPWAFPHLGRIHFHYDDATWLWHETYNKHDGAVQIPVKAPLRPGRWAVSAYALNRDTGLSFMEDLHVVDVTRMFYINMELPKGAVKGEQLGVQVSVYNYWTQPIEAIVRLRGSRDYRFVNVEDFGWAQAYNPRTSSGDVMTMVSLRPNDVRYVHFPILPTRTGDVTVTVEADSAVNRQTMSATVFIRMDGIRNTYHTPYLIDLINSGSLILPDLAIVVPERFVMPNQREHLYVPGSQRATVSLVGDVMGPGFVFDNLGAWNTLNKASGQGSTYIFDVGIDIIWLRYLKAANQLTEDRLQKTLAEVNKDLTIMYSYLKPDGHFNMFRNRAAQSTWITAFGLETLADCIESEWEYHLYIDVEILNKIVNWLVTMQNPLTGAFHESSIWYDRKMLDPKNMTDENGISRNISLTAYTIISLTRAKPFLTGDAAGKAHTAITLGADYLFKYMWDIWDRFQICIVTYALHMANHRSKTEAFHRMKKLQIEDEFVYWSNEPIPKNPIQIVNTIIYQYPKLDQPHEGFAIQATGYGLMVYLIQNKLQDAIPIMKWLQTQRNLDGAFAGQQDTIVALRALSQFSDRDTNRGLYNMLVSLEATSSPGWKKDIHLHRGQVNNYTTYEVPEVWGSVRPRAQGTGYALLQLTVRVNVEHPWQVRRPVKEAFDLVVDELIFSGRNGSRMDMKVCTRWLRTDLAPRSGYTILEADIPTGYRVDKQVLRDGEREGPYNIWKRSRFTRQKVFLHIDYIVAENWTCFHWYALRRLPVANGTIQHKIRIYEEFEPGNHNTTFYTTYDLFHNHICLVCGSFQCPYCPYYNDVPTLASSVVLIIVTLISTFALTNLYTGHPSTSRHLDPRRQIYT